MQKELDNILAQFPEFRGKIIALYNNNEEFKLLCEDYWQCKSTLMKFQEHLREDVHAEREYVRLCLDLELDALRYLKGTK